MSQLLLFQHRVPKGKSLGEDTFMPSFFNIFITTMIIAGALCLNDESTTLGSSISLSFLRTEREKN